MRSPSSSFSPLFIGEYSATTANKICFILRSNLSVPSSSGNTLQPALERLGWNEARFPFSPLFIGEYSATKTRPHARKTRPTPFSPLFIGEYSATNSRLVSEFSRRFFQSPLHRGILCNPAASAASKEPILPFSPLFIGEYSATPGR